jgi:hypothetical protein
MRPRLDARSLATLLPAGVLLLVLVAAAGFFVADGARVIRFPYPMDYGEGPLLDQTQRLGRLESLYRADLAAPPYTVSNYPPVYPLVLSPLGRLWGPAFWYGRLLSWLSIVAAAVFVGLILEALTRDRLAAVMGGLALLAFPPVAYWSSLYRVDALALALSLAGVWLVVRRPAGRLTVPAAAALLVAAIYTRQSYGVAAPLAACVWLGQATSWRRALALAALTGGLGAGLFLALDVVTGGGFSFNIVSANLNAYQAGSLAQYLTDVWALMPFALAAVAAFLLLAPWFRVPSWQLVAPYVLGAVVSGLTVGKVGSNVNYLIELGAGVSLSIGAVLAWQRPHRAVHGVIALFLALDLTLVVLASPYRTVTYVRLKQGEDARHLLDVIHRAPGIVLADEDMGLLPLDGRPIFFQPFEMTQLARAGRWDQRPFLAEIERQAFAAILIYRIPELPLHRQRWTDEMLEAIERRYVVEERVGPTEVYRPRSGG